MLKSAFEFTIILICILYFIAVIAIPSPIIDLTKNSAIIWFEKVFPSLFPYFIITNILVYTNVIYYISYIFYPIAKKIFRVSNQGFFAYFIGILSGYPVGIKMVCNLYNQSSINKNEATKLLFYVNNSGPLFIIGTVGISLLKSEKYGQLIFLSHVLSSIIISIAISFIYKSDSYSKYVDIKKILNLDVGQIFYNSVSDALNSIFMVGGFIILFFNLNFILDYIKVYPRICQILNTLFKIDCDIIKSLLYGFFELTNGVIILNNSPSIGLFTKLLLSTLIVSWGGISVHFQSISFLNKSNLPIKNYIIGKLIHSLLSMIILISLYPMYFFV